MPAEAFPLGTLPGKMDNHSGPSGTPLLAAELTFVELTFIHMEAGSSIPDTPTCGSWPAGTRRDRPKRSSSKCLPGRPHLTGDWWYSREHARGCGRRSPTTTRSSGRSAWRGQQQHGRSTGRVLDLRLGASRRHPPDTGITPSEGRRAASRSLIWPGLVPSRSWMAVGWKDWPVTRAERLASWLSAPQRITQPG
jgi:hypothetical protein